VAAEYGGRARDMTPKILIVDDREANLFALREVLRSCDAELIEATNGNDALAAALHHEFALAILDVQMPGMDGYELANLLHEDEATRHLPIIFVSAVDKEGRRGYESGAVDFITKPFDPVILDSKVRVFLKLDAQHKELEQHRDRLGELVEARTAAVTEAMNKVEHLNKVLRAIRSVNQLVVREHDPQKLFEQACENLVEARGWRAAWITFPATSQEPVFAAAGNGQNAKLLSALRTGATPACAVEALSRPGVLISDSTLCDGCPLGTGLGPHVGLTTRLEYEDQLFGVMSVLGFSANDVGDPEETALFAEMAGDLGFAMHSFDEEAKRRHADLALKTSEEKFRALTESTSDRVWEMDARGSYTYSSPAGLELLGYEASHFVGRSPHDFMPRGEADRVRQELRKLFSDRAPLEAFVSRSLHRNGHSVILETSGRPFFDEAGQLAGYRGIDRDITERHRIEAQLSHLASHDSLTGLFNRRLLDDKLADEVRRASRYKTEGALLWIDLDGFKEINDSLGHLVGDEYLKGLATLLGARRRGSDVVARMGGDEFAVLLPHVDAARAASVAGHVLEEIRGHGVLAGERMIRTTASIGVVLFPEHGSSSEELLAFADLAMYQAKDLGGDRFVVYDPDEDRQLLARTHLIEASRIRHALSTDGFVLFLQPIVDLSGRDTHYEVLLRMKGEDGGLVPPGAFLPLAERKGLIQQIDRWVVRQAVRMLGSWGDDASGPSLAINLSGKTLADTDMQAFIESTLDEHGVTPRRVIFEITETAAITNIAQARDFVHGLGQLGCRFALDDFGVGFTSFFHLKHLPVDFLKIDGAFVRELLDSTVDQHLVRAMTEVARGLGMQTVAEWVEDEATLELLRELRVDHVQGYHLGRPRPAAEVRAEAEDG
jgi:diguanylate cyclase (GGDEF)-like protein/PAS domain S-box-containing protein